MVVALVATVVGVSSSASADEVDDSIGRAECGPGSDPETGVQGQVPAADRISGRSMQGYRCNLELLGQYQGTGSGPVSPVADRCSYSATFAGGLLSRSPGVQVVDASDPTNPRLSKILGSTAMKISTWETLKVNEKRGLMVGAGVQVLPGLGVGALDVYDVSKDCANPTLLNGTGRGQNTKPLLIVAHEGGFTPDGMTYYATSAYGGTITAVDLANPARPRTVFIGAAGLTNHGFSFSEDGRTMYGVTAVPAGLQIIDVSDIQDRKKIPLIREISSLSWADGLASQMTIPFISKGHPYLYVVDEAGNGNVRVVDIEDPRNPKVIRKMRLEIGNEANAAKRSEDVGGDGLFGYESHLLHDRQAGRSDGSRLRLLPVRHPRLRRPQHQEPQGDRLLQPAGQDRFDARGPPQLDPRADLSRAAAAVGDHAPVARRLGAAPRPERRLVHVATGVHAGRPTVGHVQ